MIAEHLPAWLELWGNASSIHQSGRGPKTLIRDARENFARMIGANPLEVVFTSGGSEANNHAIKGVFEAFQKPGPITRPFRRRYLVSSVEHPSVKRAMDFLRERGAEIVEIPVNRRGEINVDFYSQALDDQTALVSIMAANNETGTIFPIRKLAEMARSRGALFHSDCVQALGKIPLDVCDLGVDLASFSGHKFYSLKGAGALFIRKGVTLESLIHGGGQERHRRGGTENALAIASLGAMCELKDEVAARAECVAGLRDHLEARVLAEIADVTVTATENARLPNTSSFVIRGADGETMLMNLDMLGYAVSTGAACSSGSPEPSPVLLAMGLSRSEAQNSLRVGLGWENTRDEIDSFVTDLRVVVARLRSFDRFEEATHAQP